LCGAQYPLQAALDYVPPPLEIVPPPALEAADDASHAMNALAHEEHLIQAEHLLQAEPLVAPETPEISVPGGMVAATPQDANALSEVAELSADVFDAAIGLEEETHVTAAEHPSEGHPAAADSAQPAAGDFLSNADDVPFVAESDGHEIDGHGATEHLIAEDATGEHEMAFHDAEGHEDHFGEHEFRFADEGSAEHEMEASEFSAVHGSPHEEGHASQAMGDIATMAAKPPQKKRKFPLAVRLIGIGIFFGIGAVGCYLVAAAFLYFGIADVPEFSRGLFPDALVAQSLKQQRHSGKNVQKPSTQPQTTTTSQSSTSPDAAQTTSTVADANADNNRHPAGDKSGDDSAGKLADKSSAAENTTPVAAGSEKAAPTPAIADTNPQGKADPATNPFDNPKPNDSDVAKDDAAKLDPLAGASKAPSLDLPPVKPSGKKPYSAANSPPDKSADEKKPIDQPADVASRTSADAIAPKADVSFSVDDVTAAVAAAERSNAALADAVKANDEAKLKAARLANFRAMSHLATAVTFAKSADSKQSEELSTLKSQIAISLASSAAATPDEREIIGGYARVGLGSKSRKESGLLMAGTLKSIDPHGKFYESQLELPGATEPIVLITPQKPAAGEGSDVILLGAVVNEPAKNLPGYEGTADRAVFADVLVAAPKAETTARSAK
jgi:hypothetical protein